MYTNTLRFGSFLFLVACAIHAWAAVPPAPLDLDAAQNDDTGVPTLRLTWIDPGPDEERFKIERKFGAAGTYSEIASLSAGSTAFRDGSVTANGTYFYRMRGWNAASGHGPYSNEAAVNFDTAAGDGNDLGWTLDYSYDPFGNVTQTKAGTTITNVTYDVRGRKISTSEPNMGTWTYAYNVLNEVVLQTDAKSQKTAITYDKLGRIKTRTEPDLISNWTYDSCSKGVGRICQVTADNGYSRTHSYDSLGRPSQSAESIGGTGFTVGYGYDSSGRLAQTTYPTGFVLKNVYNGFGHLQRITDNAGTTSYWRANTVSPSGRVLNETFANGLATTRAYDPLDRITSNVVSGGAGALQNFSYSYDPAGNVAQRTDALQSVTETFSYDKMNRLDVVSGPGLATKTFSYARNGNILHRSDVGTYTYDATKHHAVTSVAGSVNATYTYDANGNMTSGNGRTVTYTSYNMPATITGNGATYTYTNSADHERVRLIHSILGTFIYVHPHGPGRPLYERQTRPSGLIEHKHYLTAGNKLIGVHITRSDATAETRYFHGDSLGSLTLVSNASGSQLDRLSYEAFGKRRFPNGGTDSGNTINPASTDRGFTGHEHLDEIGLIHMNGRVYDPVLARFMTPDPFVHSPRNLASYNRYAYALNNPLAGPDLSGFGGIDDFFDDLGDAAEDFVDDVDRAIDRYIAPVIEYALDHPLETIAIIGVSYGIGLAAEAAVAATGAEWATVTYAATEFAAAATVLTPAGTVAAQAVAGGVMGGLSGGDLKSVFRGAAAGGVLGAADVAFTPGTFQHVVGKSIAGGIAAEIQGGHFTAGLAYFAATSGARYVYRSMVGYDVTAAPGTNRERTTYDADKQGRIPPQDSEMNIIGFNDPLTNRDCVLCADALKQGGSVSRALNLVPGANATGRLDNWINYQVPPGLGESAWFKAFTIPAALAVTGGALFDRVPLYRPHSPFGR